MCRLFGFRSAVPSKAHRSLVVAENALGAQSHLHPDGWGIGWFEDEEAYVIKSANAAHACDRFRKASTVLTSHTFLVHVRRATVGVTDHLNAHPFRHGRWLFAHNGTLFDFPTVAPWLASQTLERFQPLILGETDSERLFYFILSRLVEAGGSRTGRDPTAAGLVAGVVRQALLDLDAACLELGARRPIVNVLLTDGRVFIAHRAGMPLHMATQKAFCADFDTCPEPSKVCMLLARPANTKVNHLLVASEPIAAEENRWETVEDGTTLALDERFFLRITPPTAGWTQPELPEEYRAKAAPTCRPA
ncbi:MAG: class II glutamine amidotransferase [Alphaproteobacteria bacterium]|nr:class II glutamine amidotransferase [Alphaproteobacteria bacterium]